MLANHWSSRKHLVTIITMEAVDTKEYYDIDPKIDLVRLSLPSKSTGKLTKSTVVKRILAIRRSIKKIAPDVIFSFLTRTNILTLFAVWGFDVPVIVSERNNPAVQPMSRFWQLSRRLLYPRAFGLVTMTQGAMDFFPKAMRARSWIIPNAVKQRASQRDCQLKNAVTAVGRLTNQKGFDLLLEAFAQIAPDFREWKLVIWGEGDDRGQLEAQRDRLGLAGRVDMPGVTIEPGAWIESADIFVLSSRYEGWGNVLLEAMASGLPVVSADCEWGPREMVTDGHDGLLFKAGDVAALARSLARVIGDPHLRERLGHNAFLTAQKYSPGRVMADWDRLLETVFTRDATAV